MLLAKAKPGTSRSVAVYTRNPVFNRLFAGIVEEWGFRCQEDLRQAEVLFLERGVSRSEVDHEQVVWLTPMPLTEETFLESPISLTELYHLLEERFFPSPRRHIRVSLDVSADLKVDGHWLEGRLISLSDRGARLICSRELSRQQALCIETKLSGRMLRLQGQVLYSIPAGEARGRENPQVGVLFQPLDAQIREALRRFVERSCILRACERNGIALNDPATSWIQLVDDAWRDLP